MNLFDFPSDSKTPVFVPMPQNEFHLHLAREEFFSSNFAFVFKRAIPSLIEKLRSSLLIVRSEKVSPDIASIQASFADMERGEISKQYLAFADTQVQVPEGFVGEFLPFAETLIKLEKTLLKDIESSIGKFRVMVGRVISESAELASPRDISSLQREIRREKETVKSEMSQYYDLSSHSRRRLADVVPSYRDVRELFHLVKQISKYVDMQELRKVEKLINDVCQLLSILETKLQSDESTEVSREAAKGIADAAYELGSYVEQFVVFNYSCISLISCTRLMFEQLKTAKIA